MNLLKWEIQEAKSKFSEVVRRAIKEGPQTITRHSKDSVVILSMEDYEKMNQQETSLIGFFQDSPLASIELILERDKSPARDIPL